MSETQPSAPSASMSCARSDVGHVRRTNEDAFLDAREQGLWVVADGMGGHSRGDRASQAIIERLQGFSRTEDAQRDLGALIQCLDDANAFCRDASDGQVMGSTVAALLAHGEHTYILWAGDSRVYRYRDDHLHQLTDDHSLVMELYRLGELTESEAENHPSSNVITRAVGVNDELDLQVREASLKPGDRFLLCSDGLFKDISRDELAEHMAHPSPDAALKNLINLALRRGGGDNITAIIVQIQGSADL